LTHGILASALLITDGEIAEDPTEFEVLLDALHRDLAPVGALEEMLVEKIAVCHWRQNRALRCEAGLASQTVEDKESTIFRAPHFIPKNSGKPKTHLNLPLDDRLDRILRYETTIQRQLAYAISQLERLQRARKGECIPAPANVQVSSDM
jgi:hypothetical protein